MSIQLLATTIATKIITASLTVRIHSRIAADYPWARLWYLLHGLDDGSGHLTIPLAVVATFLDCSDKSIYRWLITGKRKGAFRYYKVENGILEVYLGGRNAVSRHLNLKNWGAVAVLPLVVVTSLATLRAVATAATTQQLQQGSRYAANHNLKKEYRKPYGAPHPNELVPENTEQFSPKSTAGETPFILHTSSTRIFASKGFTHYGTSQKTIALELGVHPRTVRRHLGLLEIPRRQICQAKYEYGQLHRSFVEHEIEEAWGYDKNGTGRTDISYRVLGNNVIFSDGTPLGAKPGEKHVNTYNIPQEEFGNRFFKRWGKWWMNRCNVYREVIPLTTMRAARRKYHYQLSQCQLSEKAAPGLDNRF